jgi:hypothetical protein
MVGPDTCHVPTNRSRFFSPRWGWGAYMFVRLPDCGVSALAVFVFILVPISCETFLLSIQPGDVPFGINDLPIGSLTFNLAECFDNTLSFSILILI